MEERAIVRFWSWVDIRSRDECWLWNGVRNRSGYGRFIISRGARKGAESRRYFGAHRLAFEFSIGAIPDGLLVCHRCDVRHCCNPDHLFLGSNSENMADMVAKGRARSSGFRGEQLPQAKLNEDTVRAIRATYASGERTQRELSERYGIQPSAISLIVTRKRWKHVG